MTKKIDTLIEDIYKVVDEGVLDDNEEHIDQMANEIGAQLKRRLIANKDEEEHRGIRLSSVGQCIRKQWYQAKGYEGEKIQPATKIKFIFGDLIEALVLCLAKMAGHDVRGEQDEVEINGVKGHRDAVIDGYTVDVKSASKYGFRKFAEGTVRDDDAFGYTEQLASYVEGASDIERDAAFNLAVAKELGTLALYRLDKANMPDVRNRVDMVVTACNSSTPPERPYSAEADGKSGNEKLGIACSYCPFKHKCWEDANDGAGIRTFIYSTGPRYLTKVVREPDVQEVL